MKKKKLTNKINKMKKKKNRKKKNKNTKKKKTRLQEGMRTIGTQDEE